MPLSRLAVWIAPSAASCSGEPASGRSADEIRCSCPKSASSTSLLSTLKSMSDATEETGNLSARSLKNRSSESANSISSTASSFCQ